MYKRFGVFAVLVFLYMYTLTFNIFMTSVLRAPAPLIFGLPLIFFLSDPLKIEFSYKYELVVFFLAAVLYHLLGLQEVIQFISVLITTCCCALFFNYFVGYKRKRFSLCVTIFYALLAVSAVVMLLDHKYKILDIRSLLVGEPVVQSPSGISVTIFTYGYQLAALAGFITVYVALKKRSLIAHLFSIAVCLVLIFYGLQRSALIAFLFTLGLFWVFYYRMKAVFLIAGISVAAYLVMPHITSDPSDKEHQNLFSKNVRSKEEGENRSGLIAENINIITEYPLGLIAEGKTWNEVVKHNLVYKSGNRIITSHNAYLMFITYSGIVPGLIFLFLIYRKLGRIIWFALKNIHDRKHAMLVALCLSFISVSVNSIFHNEWLLGASGPTLFLYFSILHLYSLRPRSAKKPSSAPPAENHLRLVAVNQ